MEDEEIVADALAQCNGDDESEEEEATEDCRLVTPAVNGVPHVGDAAVS